MAYRHCHPHCYPHPHCHLHSHHHCYPHCHPHCHPHTGTPSPTPTPLPPCSISQVQTFGLALVLLCRVHYRRLHMTMPRKRLLVCQTRELQNSLLAKLTLMMEGAVSGTR